MIPESKTIKPLNQWVTWRREERDGKPTKVPYSPLTGTRASTTDPGTWGGYTEAVAACEERGHDGVGFVFTEEDAFCGVDLDGCVDPETDEVEPWAQEVVDELDSYAEISPSGTGVHVLVKAELPKGRNRKGPIEIYDRGRYFTVTGRHLEGTPHAIEDRQEQILALGHRFLGEPPGANGQGAPPPTTEPGLSDGEVLAKAGAADNGEKFRRLWAGDTSGYGSASEADQALLSLLAFWTGPDPTQMNRLFRRSGLYRAKWEREDYREKTITRALAGRTEFYRPERSARLKIGGAGMGDPQHEEVGTLLSDVEAEEVGWLWPSWLALGKLVLVDGDPGLGKSAMTLDLAARVSSGAVFPDGARFSRTGRGLRRPGSCSSPPRTASPTP
jgi:primase-polymerase (primpol)-like protein